MLRIGTYRMYPEILTYAIGQLARHGYALCRCSEFLWYFAFRIFILEGYIERHTTVPHGLVLSFLLLLNPFDLQVQVTPSGKRKNSFEHLNTNSDAALIERFEWTYYVRSGNVGSSIWLSSFMALLLSSLLLEFVFQISRGFSLKFL